VWPASQPFPNQDQAYVFAAARTWAPLFSIVGLTLLVAILGPAWGRRSARRAAVWMGRSNALPKSFFGVVDEKHRVPRNNVSSSGLIVLVDLFS